METCDKCGVQVRTAGHFCPLCGASLTRVAEMDAPGRCLPDAPENEYPDLSREIAKYNFIYRLVIFISVLGCGVCVLVNLLTSPGFLWCLIVLAATVYAWLVIPPMLRRGANFGRQIVMQVIFTSALAIALDFIIGWHGWSLTYALPAICAAGIVATGLMSIFNRTRWAQYVLYQVIAGIFGFVPLLLYALGLSTSRVMVLVTASLALASILATAVLGDRTVRDEFKRRFHY